MKLALADYGARRQVGRDMEPAFTEATGIEGTTTLTHAMPSGPAVMSTRKTFWKVSWLISPIHRVQAPILLGWSSEATAMGILHTGMPHHRVA